MQEVISGRSPSERRVHGGEDGRIYKSVIDEVWVPITGRWGAGEDVPKREGSPETGKGDPHITSPT